MTRRLLRGSRFALAVLLRAVCPWPYLYAAERRLAEHRRVRVLVGLRKRVALDASLDEFATWGAMLTGDEAGRGRPIAILNGKVTVAIRRSS